MEPVKNFKFFFLPTSRERKIYQFVPLCTPVNTRETLPLSTYLGIYSIKEQQQS
jgi:hypothetical protein